MSSSFFIDPSTLDPKTLQVLSTQVGGFVSTSLFYPIDTVRCRTMSHDNTTARLHHNNSIRYRGILRPISLVVEHEGVAALYRGVTVAVGGATASWGIYLYLYKTLQEGLRARSGWEPNFLSDCATSTAASIGCAYLTTPIWHVKTRMQLEDTTTTTNRNGGVKNSSGSSSDAEKNSNNIINKRKYRGFFRSLFAVYKSDGFFGLWRGFSPQLLMSAVNGVYFPVYQKALQGVRTASNKLFLSSSSSSSPDLQQPVVVVTSIAGLNKNNSNSSSSSSSSSKPSTWEVAIASAGAKTTISALSNPLFVLRTRLQDERHSTHEHIKYRSLLQSATTIMKQEGLAGFYKGLRAGLLVTAPRSMTTMVVAEHLYHKFASGHSSSK